MLELQNCEFHLHVLLSIPCFSSINLLRNCDRGFTETIANEKPTAETTRIFFQREYNNHNKCLSKYIRKTTGSKLHKGFFILSTYIFSIIQRYKKQTFCAFYFYSQFTSQMMKNSRGVINSSRELVVKNDIEQQLSNVNKYV